MSKKMFAPSKNQAVNYTIMEKHGYFKPGAFGRKLIKDAFAKIGKTIYGLGYDLIDEGTKRNLDEIQKITATKNKLIKLNAKKITLYELKSNINGCYGKKIIDNDFNGFSYGISINEIRNFKELGSKYKMIYLNCKTKKIKILPFKDIPVVSMIGYQCVVGSKKKNLNINEIPLL